MKLGAFAGLPDAPDSLPGRPGHFGPGRDRYHQVQILGIRFGMA